MKVGGMKGLEKQAGIYVTEVGWKWAAVMYSRVKCEDVGVSDRESSANQEAQQACFRLV